MKKLYEFDKITTPEDWIEDALNIEKQVDKQKIIPIQSMNATGAKELEDKETIKLVGKHRKSFRFMGRVSKAVIAAVVVLAIAGASTLSYFAAAGRDFSMSEEEKAINGQPFTILLSGTDQEGEVKENGRSDANILISVNPKTKKLAVVVTDRDAYVYIPNQNGNSGYDKLTHASNAGIDVLEDTLSNLYNMDVDYYSKVDFTGMPALIDALGGITVYSDSDFTTGLEAGSQEYEFHEGYNECDGAKALAFCRERKAFKDQAMRSEHQVAVVQAVLDKMMSTDILYNLDEIFENISDMMLTDMTKETMIALIKGQINSLAEWQYTTYCVTGRYATKNGQVYGLQGMSVMILDEESIMDAREQMQSVLNGE